MTEVQETLLSVTKIKAKPDETAETFTARVVKKVVALPDDVWGTIPNAVQAWVNTRVTADDMAGEFIKKNGNPNEDELAKIYEDAEIATRANVNHTEPEGFFTEQPLLSLPILEAEEEAADQESGGEETETATEEEENVVETAIVKTNGQKPAKKAAAKKPVATPKKVAAPAKAAAKKTTAPKKASDDAARKGRKGTYDLTAKIKLLAGENPKRKGSEAHRRFAKYKDGMTVEQALAAGLNWSDMRWDSSHQHIRIT